MADELKPPVLKAEITSQIVNEGASYQLNLSDFIQSRTEADGKVHFFAERIDGQALPQGLICLPNGMLSGIPAKGTHGTHEISVTAENDSGIPFTTQFALTIKEALQMDAMNQHFTELKAKI